MENKNMNLGILKTKSIKSTIKDAIIRIIVKDVLPDDIQDKFKNIKLLYLDSGIIAYGDRGMISSSTDLTRWRHSTIGIENLNDAILFKSDKEFEMYLSLLGILVLFYIQKMRMIGKYYYMIQNIFL